MDLSCRINLAAAKLIQSPAPVLPSCLPQHPVMDIWGSPGTDGNGQASEHLFRLALTALWQLTPVEDAG